MSKSDKELAVKLACAVLDAMKVVKPITGEQVDGVLKDCYQSILSLEDFDCDSGM